MRRHACTDTYGPSVPRRVLSAEDPPFLKHPRVCKRLLSQRGSHFDRVTQARGPSVESLCRGHWRLASGVAREEEADRGGVGPGPGDRPRICRQGRGGASGFSSHADEGGQSCTRGQAGLSTAQRLAGGQAHTGNGWCLLFYPKKSCEFHILLCNRCFSF